MEQCFIQELPEEVLWQILSSLDAKELILHASLVCKRWHNAVRSPSFWRDVGVDANDLGLAFGPLVEKYPYLYSVHLNVFDASSLTLLHALQEKRVNELYVAISLDPFTPLFSPFHQSANIPLRVTQKLKVSHSYDDFWLNDSFTSNLIKRNCRTLTSVEVCLSHGSPLSSEISLSISLCQNVTKLRIPAPSVTVAFSLPHLADLTVDVEAGIKCHNLWESLKTHENILCLRSLSVLGGNCFEDNSEYLTLLGRFCANVNHIFIQGDCWKAENVLSIVQSRYSVTITSKAFTKDVFDSLLESGVKRVEGTMYIKESELKSVREVTDTCQKSINVSIHSTYSGKRIWDWMNESDF